VIYEISLTEAAEVDLAYYDIRNQRIIAAGIIEHLRIDAHVPSARRKLLRPNPLAPWELRLRAFRVFYTLEGGTVKVLAAGHKEHNVLYIRGDEVKL
jgi:mRNA-degrading endonuclease RelE of RelBE toxin-antitoxin system